MSSEVQELKSLFPEEWALIEEHLHAVLKKTVPSPGGGLQKLWDSLEYSLFSSGKRFRPLLSVLTAKALHKDLRSVLPVATAVELIHTYSLIHDDLLCMDNDDFRRGLPTNHKKFGEPTSLLAGDGLLTLAFFILAQGGRGKTQAFAAVELIASAAGLQGMVGGQMLDIHYGASDILGLEKIHQMKTGALIEAAVCGAALWCDAGESQFLALKAYSKNLGLAFQLADDLQDAKVKKERVSYVGELGEAETLRLLKETSQKGLDSLKTFDGAAEGLRSILQMTVQRSAL